MSSISFSRIIFSGLLAKIGIGNRIVKHLEVFIDIDVEDIPHEEFQLHASKTSFNHTIKSLRDLKEVWTKSPDGGQLLQKKTGGIKRLGAELKQVLNATTNANKSAEKDSLKNNLNTLIATQARYTQQISQLDKYLKDANSRLNVSTKSQRNGEESVNTAVDKIFQSIGANQAHYFGHAF
jgi:hypothetical protein